MPSIGAPRGGARPRHAAKPLWHADAMSETRPPIADEAARVRA